MNITWDNIRAIFFPRTFEEKFRYLGSVPYDNSEVLLKHLTIVLDYYAKPTYVPRWFLRFLHLFGNDNSIVRVRNYTLYKLHRKLTKGLMIWDYKTKWDYYDLRISISGNNEHNRLVDAITRFVYYEGYRKELLNKLSKIPNAKYNKYDNICDLINEYNKHDKDND